MAPTVPGQRLTKQRAAIASLLEEVPEFRSAQDLHEQLRRHGHNIGLTTVYRTLQALADAGEIDTLRIGSGEAAYRRCSPRHHHHLVCRACGRTVEVDGPAVEKWTEQVATVNGFTDISHTAEIFGICPTCHTGQRATGRPPRSN